MPRIPRKITSIIWICAALLSANHAREGSAAPAEHAEMLYPAVDLRDDFGQLRRAIEHMHPGLYDFTGAERFDRLFEAQLALIEGPMTVREFYRVTAPLVAAIGCGHCKLMAPGGFWIVAPARLFPLALRFISGVAYVYRTFESAPEIPVGVEVAGINGRPMAEIIDTLASIIPADGYNEASRMYRLNDGFSFLYALWYGFPERFTLSYVSPGGGGPAEATVQGIDARELGARISEVQRDTGRPGRDLRLEFPEGEDAAIVTIGSFDYYDEVDSFRAFVDSAFAAIRDRGTGALILDLRGNDGGDPFCSTHLLSYLEPRPVPYYAETYLKYRKFSKPIPLADKRFEGRLFVLTDGGCFSSTGHLCAVLKGNGIGAFVGGETGGTFTCTDATTQIVLNHTKLRANISRMKFIAAAEGLPRDRGIIPDYPVTAGIDDLLEGRDPVMERALALARESK